MSKPVTLLDGLCGHALSLGANSRHWVLATKDGSGFSIASYASSSADSKELLGNLYAAAKKPVQTGAGGSTHPSTIVHCQTGSIPGIHLLLHQDSRSRSRLHPSVRCC
jgi:hypothetical protein